MPTITNRDLAAVDIWQRSLERSQRRRVLADSARKEQSRKKSASLAVTAAVATAPVWPTVAATANDLSKNDASKLAKKLRHDHIERVLLKKGDSNSAVLQVQKALKVQADGVYGPLTQAAIKQFQARVGLPTTGDVDVRTWLKLFPTDMIVYAPPAAAKAMGVGDGTGGPQWTAVDAGESQKGAPHASAAKAGHRRADHGHHGRAAAGIGRAAIAGVKASDLLPGDDGSGDPVGVAAPGVPSAPGGGAPSSGGVGGGGPPASFPAPKGSAAEMIKAMIGAANRIDRNHYAYSWGGGHNSSFSGPYDCSGAVSAVLHAAGLLKSPMVSGDFAHWGRPGRGAVTLYANASHVYMSINGHFFGTSSANPGGGAGWFAGGARPGFAVVHVPFERMHFKNRTREKRRALKRKHKRARIQHRRRQQRRQQQSYGGPPPTSAGSGYAVPQKPDPQPQPQWQKPDPSQSVPSQQQAPAPVAPAPQPATTPATGTVQQAPAVAQTAPTAEQPAPQVQSAPTAGVQAPAPSSDVQDSGAPAQEQVAPKAPTAPSAPAQEPAASEQQAAPDAPSAPQQAPQAPDQASNPTPAAQKPPETPATPPAEAPSSAGSGSGSASGSDK